MLGIFDSGLGGLTVLRQVRAALPDENVVYFADQAHVPYGDRDDDDLASLLARNVAHLEAAGADAIVVGCNTSCAVAARRGWPPARIPIFDLIEGAADMAVASGARRIGVVATAATARSGAYGDAIRRRDPAIDVREVAAPALVPLVEAGHVDGADVRTAVAAACTQLGGMVDAVVLGCTHYPLLDAAFAAVLGPHVARIDPAVAQAARSVAFVRERGSAPERGTTLFLTTGPLEPYRDAVTALAGPLAAGDRFAEVDAATVPSSC